VRRSVAVAVTTAVVTVGSACVAVPVAALLLVAPSRTPVMDDSSESAAPATDGRAMRLLDRASVAGARTAYRGTAFVSAWTATGTTSVVVDVQHQVGAGTRVRSVGTARNPAMDTHLPDRGARPSIDSDVLGLLAHHYDVVAAGSAQVAGRPTDLVEARRTGTSSLAARFWLDRATGLVLRREVYDGNGRITRASAFVDITIGRPHEDAAAGASASPWPDSVDPTTLARMRTAGWRCPRELPGSLQMVDARRGSQRYSGILHLSYSDGLSTVSLFLQRGRLDESGLTGYRRTTVDGDPVYVLDSVPARVVWSADGTVYTIVADAPPRTVDQVVASLPHTGDEPGGWQRLSRGLGRVASWFNPFG
jgi:sigma-E factor negative regulatory protein RseB